MSKSLKQIAYDTIEAHQETIADLRTQLAKANERVGKLEKERSNLSAKYKKNVSVIGAFVSELTGKVIILPKMRTKEEIEKSFNKFAIEKKVEALEDVLQSYVPAKFHPTTYAIQAFNDGVSHLFAHIQERIEQLRKEQASE